LPRDAAKGVAVHPTRRQKLLTHRSDTPGLIRAV